MKRPPGPALCALGGALALGAWWWQPTDPAPVGPVTPGPVVAAQPVHAAPAFEPARTAPPGTAMPAVALEVVAVEPFDEPAACAAAEADDPHGVPRQRWLAALQSAADERQRAAGWLIGLVDAPADGATLRDRLATLAATSRDALVQAYAWRACRGDASPSSACQALAPDAWAAIEPDNAAAWLALAADPRLDTDAQLDALRHAAASPRLENHGAALHALAQSTQPRGAGGLDRVMMARDIVEARADWLGGEALRRHCSAQSLADAQRVPVCDAVAALLAARAQNLPDLLEARETGQRVGWPAQRLDALRDESRPWPPWTASASTRRRR